MALSAVLQGVGVWEHRAGKSSKEKGENKIQNTKLELPCVVPPLLMLLHT